ncbi:SEC10/PgrA surface exclusion domain-containing protein [Streptococcus hyointestinalis]|nr:SEC10/PgrA surface exclusion domain-containing protein [Streptococcus hyointestinalis]
MVKAQENAKNAVNADKKAVSQAEDNVTSAKAADEARQKAIEEAQAKVTTAETANTNAEKVLKTATEATNKGQTKAEQAKSETANAQTAVDQAQAVLDGTGQAEIVKAQQEAQSAVSADKEAVRNAETNLTNAKAADVARQTAIDEAQGDVTSAETVAKNAKTALNNATSTATNTTAKVEAERAEVEKAQAVVAGLESEIANANTITLPEGYVEALKNYYAKKSTAGSALLSQLGKQLISNNTYKSNTADENEVISDVNNLTQAQREDITLFTVDLLNQLRKAFGTTEVVANESAIKFADEIAAAYSTDKWNSFSSSTGHDVNAIKSIASNSGLNGGGQYYENLASSLSPISSVSTNMAEVKKRIYNSLLQMLGNDAASSWGHSTSITGVSRNSKYSGVDLSSYSVSLGSLSSYIVNVHIIGVEDENVLNNSKFNTSDNLSSRDLKAELATAKSTLVTEQAQLTSATLANNQAQSALREAQTDYDNSVATLTSAQTALAAAKATPEQTPTAQAKLDEAKAQLATDLKALASTNQALANLTADVKTKQAALTAAKATLTQKQAAQEQAENELADAQAKLATAQANATTAQNNLTTAKANLASLESSQELLPSAQTALANAQAKLAADLETLKQANQALANLSADVKTKQQALEAAKANLADKQESQAKAQKVLDEALTKLDTLKAELATATSYVETAKAGVATAQNNLAEAKQTLSDLKNAPALLADAKAKLAEAQAKLEDAKANLVELTTDYEAALKALDEAKAKQAELQAVYDHLLALEKDNVVTVLPDGTVVAVPKATPTTDTLPKYTIKGSKSEPKVGLVVTQTAAGQKVTYSRVERSKALPETGEKDGSVLAFVGGVIATIGLAGVRRKRIH